MFKEGIDLTKRNGDQEATRIDDACGQAPSSKPTRRTALKIMGVAVATVLTDGPGVSKAMAGPFERQDFDKLVPADKKLSPEWVKSLFERGTPRVLHGEELRFVGMPVGGIGAGQLYIGGDGRLWHWDIFNKTPGTGSDHYANPMKPDSSVEQGFAVSIHSGAAPVTRTLDKSGFPEVSFLGQYPIATVTYQDPAFPLSVEMEGFSPFIPLSTDDSSLPATILHFTINNKSAEAVEGTLAGWLANAVLRQQPGAPAHRRNSIVRANAMSMLNCLVERDAVVKGGQQHPDLVFEDWNKDNYDGWVVEGTAFGSRPAKRAEVLGYMGDLGGDGGRFVNSHISAPGNDVGVKDGATGTLTSKPFTIERKFVNFWIGGGNHAGKTCINLIIAGKVVHTATGADSNRMSWQSFDVSALAGQQATLQIVDAEKGGWGNICIGRIVFSDQSHADEKLESAPDFGTMGLALLGEPAEHEVASGGKGAFSGAAGRDATSSLAETLTGSIGRRFHVAANSSVSIAFVLTWHFPNLKVQGLSSVGRYYSAKFDSAQAVAQYVSDHFSKLHQQTKLWRDTWYDSTLPHWLLDRTLLNACILATGTCMRFADGRFYAWEGVGCCPGTCTHVWHYAHSMARLFPDIERDLRERIDLGVAFDKNSGVMGFRAEFDRGLAVDGQAGTLLRIFREHQTAADDSFLKRNWAKIKIAFEPLLKLDVNQAGVLEGAQMNTLDQPWFGKIAWLSSLYIAAVAAGAQMAREMGDTEFADRCAKIAGHGNKNLVDQLFNGEYFDNRVLPDHLDAINSGTGCEIDQVFGQSWAWQVHLGRVLPQEQTRSALMSLWKYNFTPDVGPYRQVYKPGRWYAMPGEAGLLMATFPRSDWDYHNAKGKGPDWAAGYFNECMNGFEYEAAGHMIWEGLVKEGLAVTRAIHDRYDASHRNPWNEIECGDHYSRSMASHGVYLAACGYEYHGPHGYLGFAPRLTPEKFKSAFTAAEGWGTFSQTATPSAFQATIEVRWGTVRLRELGLTLVGQIQPHTLAVTIDGKEVAAKLAVSDNRCTITLAAEAAVEAGHAVLITLT